MLEQQPDQIHFYQQFISPKKIKLVLLVLLLSISGYFFFTLWAGWENVLYAIQQVGPLGIVAALGLSLMNYGVRFLRWQYLLKVLGYSVPWAPSLRIYMAGFSLTTTPGKTGEAIRGVFLKEYGVPFRKTFGAFLAERTSDLFSVTLLASVGLWIYPMARPLLFIVAALLAFLFLAMQKDSWLRALERLVKSLCPKRFISVLDFLIGSIHSFRSCFTMKVLVITLSLGLIAWTMEAIALLYALHLLGYEISPFIAIFIYGFSLVIGGITLLPGGLGGAEVTMFQLLVTQHIPTSIAVAVTLVIRLTSLWFSVFLGMIALPKNKILWNFRKAE